MPTWKELKRFCDRDAVGNATRSQITISIARYFQTVIFCSQRFLWEAVKFIKGFGRASERDNLRLHKNTLTAKYREPHEKTRLSIFLLTT